MRIRVPDTRELEEDLDVLRDAQPVLVEDGGVEPVGDPQAVVLRRDYEGPVVLRQVLRRLGRRSPGDEGDEREDGGDRRGGPALQLLPPP